MVVWARIETVWKRSVAVAPAVLGGVSAYFLFLVIVPFFVLGINRVPVERVVTGDVWYADALGVPAMVAAFALQLASWLLTYVWLLSLANFIVARRWHVLVILALAPLPIAYMNAGPHAEKIKYWILAL